MMAFRSRRDAGVAKEAPTPKKKSAPETGGAPPRKNDQHR